MSGKVLSAPFQYTKLQLVGLFGTLKTYFLKMRQELRSTEICHISLYKEESVLKVNFLGMSVRKNETIY